MTANPLCRIPKPLQMQGFRVLTVDFGLGVRRPVRSKFRQFYSLFLRPCGLLNCQDHTIVFAFAFGSICYVWIRESVFLVQYLSGGTMNRSS
jgi:hypothetical protein